MNNQIHSEFRAAFIFEVKKTPRFFFVLRGHSSGSFTNHDAIYWAQGYPFPVPTRKWNTKSWIFSNPEKIAFENRKLQLFFWAPYKRTCGLKVSKMNSAHHSASIGEVSTYSPEWIFSYGQVKSGCYFVKTQEIQKNDKWRKTHLTAVECLIRPPNHQTPHPSRKIQFTLPGDYTLHA